MIEQLPIGGGYCCYCSQSGNEYKSSYSEVKAYLCAMFDSGIKTCSGLNEKGLPKQQTMRCNKERKDANMVSNRAEERVHPLSKKGIEAFESFHTTYWPTSFQATILFLRREFLFLSHKGAHWKKALKNEVM